MSAQKSYVSINYPPLIQRMNIIAMSYLNNYIYAFTCEGEFLEFEADLEKQTIKFLSKKHIDEF